MARKLSPTKAKVSALPSTPFSEFILADMCRRVPALDTPVIDAFDSTYNKEQQDLLQALVWAQLCRKGEPPKKFPNIETVVAGDTHIYSTPDGDSLVLFKLKHIENLTGTAEKALLQKVHALLPIPEDGVFCLSF